MRSSARGVLFLLGRVLLALALALLAPAGVAYYYGDPGLGPFLYSALITFVAGLVLERGFRPRREFDFGRDEAIVLVTAAWATASVVGALPYVLLKGPGFLVDGLFESASGFTTTGASILSDVEAEPGSLLLWRALTQWLGGMGIIVLGIAILPRLAVGGMDLLGAEAPGPMKEKLTPRIAQTAKLLWVIYAALTLAQVAALVALGMGPLDAVAHAFSTMATGGFSTRNASVGAFGSSAIDIVIVVFMLLAGANFALHYQLFRGRPAHLKDPEFKLYVSVLVGVSLLVALNLALLGSGEGILRSLVLGTFQATSITTTTGFCTDDFDVWPGFSKALLFGCMFVGGCAGSTGGSVKVVRIAIVAKKLVVDLRRMVRPHAVLPVRLGARAIPDDVVASVVTFFILFLVLFAAGGLALSFMGTDPISAFSAAAACICNVGPGFGEVGPHRNYADLPVPGKMMLAVLMIVGRLEIYTVLVLLFLRRRFV